MLQPDLSPFPTLTTERLILRQPDITDDREVFLLRSDEQVNRYIDRPRAITVADVRQFIDKINAGIAQNDRLYWVICPADPKAGLPDRPVGTICLWNFSPEMEVAEIGYELLPEFQGKGIMQEAVAKIIEFSFLTLKLKSLEACADVGNGPSIKLLEKFNFVKTGLSENNEIIYNLTLGTV